MYYSLYLNNDFGGIEGGMEMLLERKSTDHLVPLKDRVFKAKTLMHDERDTGLTWQQRSVMDSRRIKQNTTCLSQRIQTPCEEPRDLDENTQPGHRLAHSIFTLLFSLAAHHGEIQRGKYNHHAT